LPIISTFLDVFFNFDIKTTIDVEQMDIAVIG